jgi:hypothetical protein
MRHKTGMQTKHDKTISATSRSRRLWSGYMTEHNHAMNLEPGVFTWMNPKKIAASIKASAERSQSRKSSPYRSALSMMTFYLNRGGKNLPEPRKEVIRRAKVELKRQFGKAARFVDHRAGAGST